MNKVIGIALFAAAAALSSCIKEYPDECRVSVGFVYDYNILSADAFAHQADEVTLYVFDGSGLLLKKYDRQVTALVGSSMDIDPLPAGNYRFAAWARGNSLSNANSHFQIPAMTEGQSRIEDLTYRLPTDNGEQNSELNAFLVGVQDAAISDRKGESVTVSLKKVTRKIRVVVMPLAGDSGLEAADYSFRIEEPVGNGLVNYDYSILADAPIVYRPYYYATITPGGGEVPEPGEVDRALAAEISSSRMIASHEARLKITRVETGEDIVNINLPWLLSLTGMEQHNNWSLQEYLDRQDEFSITLFFQAGAWSSATIIINGWVVNNVDIQV